MEKIKNQLEQLRNKLPDSLYDDTNECREVSIYGTGKVSPEALAQCFITIKKAFPKLPDGWYDVFEQMLDEEKFTDERLIDATKNLIKNCPYPEPTIANILGFDRTCKLHTMDELLEQCKDFSIETRKEFLRKFELKDHKRKLWGRINI